MKQHCKFRRIAESELECEHCKARIASQGDSVIRLCAAPAPDPPEREPESLPCNRRGAVMRQVSADAIGCMHESVTEYACELHGHCTLDIKVRGVKACVACMDMPISGDIPVEPLAEMHSDWMFREDAPLVLHCVLSPQFDSIYSRFFLPSLLRLRDERLGLCVHSVAAKGNGDFGTAEYVELLKRRCAIVVDTLEGMADGEIAVFCDVDIVFLNRLSERLLARMDDMDMVFANERTEAKPNEVNFGFFAVRKSSATLEFFAAIRDGCCVEKHDQDVCRELLNSTPLRWAKLPEEFSNSGLYSPHDAHRDLLFHATDTKPRDGKTSLQLKSELLESVLARRMTREAVVAHYTEDATWLRSISIPAIVYGKSQKPLPDSVPLANAGREADTYLRHILAHYDELAAATVFAQGNPFDHVPCMRTEIMRECGGYLEMDAWRFGCTIEHCEWDGSRALDAWRKLFGRTKPPQHLSVPSGAQFALTRDRIQMHSREFYQRALAVANWTCGPWILERLWPSIFSGEYREDFPQKQANQSPLPETFAAIHQCYFEDWQKCRLFDSPVYRPIALSAHRTDLCEFEAMLSVHDYGPKTEHVGFTSWRQRDKSPAIFWNHHELQDVIGDTDGCAWLRLEFAETLAEQAETSHPGIMQFIHEETLAIKGESLAWVLEQQHSGVFASYWCLRWERFCEWMEWMRPFLRSQHAYLNSHPKSLAYALERLFIIWCSVSDVRIVDIAIDKA